MTLRRITFLCILMTFTLAGCFRQASDSIETIDESDSGQTVDIASSTPMEDIAPTEDTLPQPTEDTASLPMEETNDSEEEAGEPGIAVTASTPVPIFTETPMPTMTRDAGDSDTSDGVTGAVPMESPSATFVTPAPSGPSSVSTPTSSALEAPDNVTPLVTPTNTGGNGEPSTVDEDCIYIVAPGDTVYRIALANDTSVDAIVEANPDLTPSLIRPGDELILPDCNDDGDDATDDEDPQDDAGIIGNAGTGGAGQTVHTVSSGESLFVIAQRYGVTIDAIVQENNLANPNQLSIGQQLIIPAP